MHQAGHYPGTGMAREVGAEEANGFTINVPCSQDAATGQCVLPSTPSLLPVARAFRPELVLVSAGYDSQQGDMLGGLSFSEGAFQWMARVSRSWREIGAVGPVCTWRGIRAEMEARSIVATLRGMQGDKPEFEGTAATDEVADVREALEEARPYWRGAL